MCLCLSSLRPTVRPHLIPYRSMAHRPRRSPHSRRSPLTDSRHTVSLLRPRTLMARPYQPTVSPRPTPTPTVNPHRRTAHRPPMAILTARFRRLTANTPRPLPLCRWISLTTDAPSPEAFLRFWQKYTVFRGRASRSEFWWWTLAAVIINALLSLLGDRHGRQAWTSSPAMWNLAIVVPGLALAVRRLHDTNKPGWWVAIFYIAMVIGLYHHDYRRWCGTVRRVQEPLATVMTMVMATAMRLWQPAVFGAAVIGAIDYAGRLRLSISCSWLFPASRRAHVLTMARRSTPHASGCLRRTIQHACTPEFRRSERARHPGFNQPAPDLRPDRPCQPPTMASRLHPHLITVRCRPRSTANRRPRPHSTARFRRCLETPATNPQHLLSTRLLPATMPRNPGKASNRYR